MDNAKFTREHGRTMYTMALEHAINVIEICKLDGSDPVEILRNRLLKEQSELKELETEACND